MPVDTPSLQRKKHRKAEEIDELAREEQTWKRGDREKMRQEKALKKRVVKNEERREKDDKKRLPVKLQGPSLIIGMLSEWNCHIS